jgi:hypothetical protein
MAEGLDDRAGGVHSLVAVRRISRVEATLRDRRKRVVTRRMEGKMEKSTAFSV